MNTIIASFLCAGILATASAFADDAVVPQGGNSPAASEQVKQDKATVKADRKQLHKDRAKLKKDRKKSGPKVKKEKEAAPESVPAQPTAD
jgi:hypothetical protein